MITLNSASGTGIISTTAGAKGVMASTGPFSPNSVVKVSYSFDGATSGIYAGLVAYKGNFAQSIVFPSSSLKFEIINPDPYNQINIDVFTSSGFSPVQLFSAGEQGAWYDPSDLTTLFQDSAGTIPVTTAGQPVGRMLDKSGRGNHATQATAAARPTYQTSGGLHWLAFDGIDDSMVTPTITPGVDKAQVFVGLQKLSNTTAILAESSVAIVGNVGSFIIIQGNYSGAEYTGGSRGSAVFADSFLAKWVGNTAPDTTVLTSTHDIAGDLSVIRRNGVNGINSTVDKGTGNFLAYPIYIGARGGSQLFANCNLYGMTVRFGANLSAEQITSSESYLAAKTGVALP